MNRQIKKLIILTIISMPVLLSGCSTVNNLHEYDIRGKAIAMDMMIPPEPTVEVDYSPVDLGGDVLLAAVQLGTNLVKAGGAENAEAKLRKALDGLYIPEYAAELTFDRIVKTLDGRMVFNRDQADIILEIDIDKYGLETYSYGGEVTMVFAMTASFYDPVGNNLIWKRYIDVEREVTPGFFGFDDIVGNMVTIASLNNLEEEELAEGFKTLTREIMQETIERLRKDLRKAQKKRN